MRKKAATSIEFTYRVPVVGSKEPPPQFDPPFVPGNITVGFSPIGSYMRPSTTASLIISMHCARDSGVTFVISSSFMDCRANGGGFTGNGCVGQDSSPGIELLGTGRSCTSNSGLPVSRSSRKTKPVLVACATASTCLPFAPHGDEHGLRWQIVIPKIVMNSLKMPTPFACFAIKSDNAVAEQIRSVTITAIHICRRRSERKKNHASAFIYAHQGPNIGPATILPGIACPRVMAEFPWTRHSMKPPQFAAAARIEASYVAAGTLRLPVANPRARDDGVLAHGDRRCQAVGSERKLVSHAFSQIDHTLVAETWIWLSRLRVNRKQSSLLVREQDSLTRAAFPVRYTATLIQRHACGAIELGIELPKNGSSFGIEREQSMK